MSEDDWCYQLDAHEYSKQDPSLGEIIILAIFTFVVCMFRPFFVTKMLAMTKVDTCNSIIEGAC